MRRSLHAHFLLALERASSTDAPVFPEQLRDDHLAQFLQRRWLTLNCHLGLRRVETPFGDVEVEITPDPGGKTYRYDCPKWPGRVVTGQMSELAVYAFNVAAWLESLARAFDIQPSQLPRQVELVANYLWHVGNVRVGKSHRHAPIYVGRRVQMPDATLRAALTHPARDANGVLLTALGQESDLPNSHQSIAIDDLIMSDAVGESLNGDVLSRLLEAPPSADEPSFDPKSGALKLPWMAVPRVFKGKSKAVIDALWKVRNQGGLKWAEVINQTNCGTSPDDVFGKDKWHEWIERIAYGRYAIRSTPPT